MRRMTALLCFVSANSFAISGNELHDLLTSKSAAKELEGLRYIQALRDAEEFHEMYEEVIAEAQKRKPDKSRFFCSPNGANLGQMRDIILADMQSNPADRHISAAQLAHMTLVRVWPCKD
jgi:hypothetical protein